MSFIDWLIEQGKSKNTALAYAKRVKWVEKKISIHNITPNEAMETLKKGSHLSFTRSAWNQWVRFNRSVGNNDRTHYTKEFLKLVSLLDIDLLVSMELDDRLPETHPLLFNSEVVYMNDLGTIHLSFEQHKIIKIFSKNGKLIDLA